jgi:hypothetical protein
MKKDQDITKVSYDGLNSLAEVLESCMDKFSSYQAITDKYNNVFMTFVQSEDNKTRVAEGHRIRIRPAGDENHAQLIISY